MIVVNFGCRHSFSILVNILFVELRATNSEVPLVSWPMLILAYSPSVKESALVNCRIYKVN